MMEIKEEEKKTNANFLAKTIINEISSSFTTLPKQSSPCRTSISISSLNTLPTEEKQEGMTEQVMEVKEENPKMYLLKMQPQPPEFVFKNKYFDVTLYLTDAEDNLKTGLNIPLEICLHRADKLDAVLDEKLLQVEMIERMDQQDDNSHHLNIMSSGMCKIRMKIAECSMAHGNCPFVLSVSPGQSHINDIDPIYSREMFVVENRLVIQESLPELWYKDEGGRDKCMILPISLINADGQKVLEREVPLKITLLYESKAPVHKQEILKISPDSQRHIDTSTGQATIRMRIEDVSKNHQGQSFCIKIEPDTTLAPLNFDISHDISSCISVRSKRNKRQRRTLNSSAHNSPMVSQSQPVATMSIPGSLESNVVTGRYGPINDATAHSVFGNETIAAPCPPSQLLPSSNISVDTLQNAMNSVIQWTGAVVNGLHELEWQIVGYECGPDGVFNHSRPLYRCPSCWRYKDVLTFNEAQHGSNCLVATILMNYATNTMNHLNTLLTHVDEASRNRNAPSSSTACRTVSNRQQRNEHSRLHQGSVSSSRQQCNSYQHVHQESVPPNTSSSFMCSSNNEVNHWGSAVDVNRKHPSRPKEGERMSSAPRQSLIDRSSSSSNSVNNNMSLNPSSNVTEPIVCPTDLMLPEESSIDQPNSFHSLESHVYYVLAHLMYGEAGRCTGFPAYDYNKNLLGFYQESIDNSSTTRVIFVAAPEILGISQNTMNEAQRLLESELKKSSSAVHSLSQCDNDIIKLKEDTLVYYWNHMSVETNPVKENGFMG